MPEALLRLSLDAAGPRGGVVTRAPEQNECIAPRPRCTHLRSGGGQRLPLRLDRTNDTQPQNPTIKLNRNAPSPQVLGRVYREASGAQQRRYLALMAADLDHDEWALLLQHRQKRVAAAAGTGEAWDRGLA